MDYNSLTKKELIVLVKDLKIQSYDNSRDIFISNISHDVRTLLNSIYGHTQILSNDKQLNTHHHELVNKILDASSHMIDLINEIINISKNVGVGQLNLCEFELKTFILNIYSIFESIASSKNIEIILNNEIDPEFIIKSDKNKLFYILLNIIGNAIKFTSVGSVTFNCKMNSESSILFEIIDTGIGIDNSMQKEIFQSYVRTQEGSAYEGNGLGLAIANKNIIALGSQLHIESIKNAGSKFSFIIKCEASKGNFLSFNKEFFDVKEIKSLKEDNDLFILIGEKFNKDKSILERYLNSKKIKYEICESEEKISQCLKAQQVDMIFIDTNLKANTSIDIVKKIKETDNNIPIIALTASVMSEDLKQISEIFTNYIIKPYSFSDVDQTLIFFSGKEFIFEENSFQTNHDTFIDIKNEELKKEILSFAKLGQYKKLAVLIEKVDDPKSKETLKNYLNNYNFDEIINKIEVDVS